MKFEIGEVVKVMETNIGILLEERGWKGRIVKIDPHYKYPYQVRKLGNNSIGGIWSLVEKIGQTNPNNPNIIIKDGI